MNLAELTKIPTRINGVLARLFTEKVLHKFFETASLVRGVVATYDLIDISGQIPVTTLIPEEKIGVVVQGPINKQFTQKICSFITNTYPNVKVVLSTWEGEVTDQFDAIKSLNFKIIKKPMPANAGPSNINLQIVSTISGVKFLEQMGCTHILKMRTDTFLSDPQFLNYLIWMNSKGSSNALVFSSFNSFLFRLFSVTDQVMFGNVENMLLYWDIQLESSSKFDEFPEKYLFKGYLKLKGFEPVDTFESYLDALRNFAVIADHEQLGQVWNKGAFTSLGYRWRGSYFPHSMSPLSTWLWEVIKKDDSYLRELYQKLS